MRGHLRQRAKGSWTGWIELQRAPDGRRRQKTFTFRGTKHQAEAKLSEFLHQLDTGHVVLPAKLTVSQFLTRWLSDYAVTNVRPRTLEGYRGIIDGHLIPNLGGIPLTRLQPSDLQGYYAKALREGRKDGKPGGLSARTVTHHHRVLSEALAHAVKWGLVSRNVALAVDPPRAEATEFKTLDGDGLNNLLGAAEGTTYHPVLHLAAFNGLRRSELLGLRWQDVDLYMATLSVVQVMHKLRDGRIVFHEPKTAKGRRMVALSPIAVLALRAHRQNREAETSLLGIPLADESLVFCHLDGSPMLPDTLTHVFKKILRKAGLSGVRLHDLRHTHASMMLRQGVNPKVVSERLGHATVFQPPWMCTATSLQASRRPLRLGSMRD